MDHGLAEKTKSKSEWASPCLLVDKPDGSYRMCTDSRPLPRINHLIDQLGEAKYITKIDLLRGYYDLLLNERACVCHF